MADELQWIRSFVDRLVRRERALLALRIGAATATLLLVVLALSVGAATLRLDRAWSVFAIVVFLGTGAWFTLAWPLLTSWPRVADARRQARHVEARHPDFRGRLVTALDIDAASDSPIAGLVVQRARERLAKLSVDELRPADRTLRLLQSVGLAWLIGAPLLWALAGGFDRYGDYWLAASSAQAAVADVDVAPEDPVARVGDIVIRYTYPDYTGLDPHTVSNSTGDVQGPPGTRVEVSARSARRVEAAGLMAYDEALEARVIEDGRVVTGQFAIGQDSGTYKLQLYREGEPEPSRQFTIEVEPDLPPEVMLDTGGDDVIEVALDETFTMRWQARDDYGIQRVALAVDGTPTERVLARPERRIADVGRRQTLRPRELGLSTGDRVRLAVAAWDNDTVSGSKMGMSRSVELVVLGPNGLGIREAERREELMELMIPLLADFLVEDWPLPGQSGRLARWGETVAGRYTPFVERVEALWQGLSGTSHDRAVAQRVVDTGRDLVRFTQVSFEPGSSRSVKAEDTATLDQLRDEAIVALEDGILAFHEMQRNQALAELVHQSEDLRAMAEDLERTLDKPEPDALELLSKLDALERMMRDLAERASKLDESGLREFLNSRESEASSLMQEIRDAIARGDLDEARELLKRLSQLVDEMGRGIQEEMDRRLQRGQQSDDRAAELQRELQEIEQQQRQLQSEVQQLREQDQGPSDRMNELWAELERRATQHEADASRYRDELSDANRAFFEQERSKAGVQEAQDLSAAIDARDARGARTSIQFARSAWATSLRAVMLEQQRRGTLEGPGRTEVVRLLEQLDAMEELLDQLEQAERQSSPETRQQAQELQDQQRDLDNRLQQAQEQAQQLAQDFPVRPEGMQEALEEAGERMQNASEDLQDGELMQAEGSQGVASQRIRDAIDSLRRARRQAQQEAQALRPGEQGQEGSQGQREPSDERDGGPDGETNGGDFEIPGREEFRTPEEYHQGLLEGMQGDVPEEFRAMKRRYYEELVHQ